MATRTMPPVSAGSQVSPGRGVVRLIAGSIVSLLALVLLAGGGWALWKDRMDRDPNGLLSTETSRLDTTTYAIVSELRGDGPSWLYGTNVVGDVRVGVTSQTGKPVFLGIARTDDVHRYIHDAGFATLDNFETTADTTHAGPAPSAPPSETSIWAASSEGIGRQTLDWSPRDGDWSIVLMNADASAGIEVVGDLSAELPVLPWVAGGLLIAAAALGVVGIWLLVRGIRKS